MFFLGFFENVAGAFWVPVQSAYFPEKKFLALLLDGTTFQNGDIGVVQII